MLAYVHALAWPVAVVVVSASLRRTVAVWALARQKATPLDPSHLLAALSHGTMSDEAGEVLPR